MVLLYRTAYVPVHFKAFVCSFAFLFRIICIIIQYLGPALIAFFYILDTPGSTIDKEFPQVSCGRVYQVIAHKTTPAAATPPITPDDIIFPSSNADFETGIDYYPTFENNRTTELNIVIRIYWNESTDKYIGIDDISVVFGYQVAINKWAHNNINALGTFKSSFFTGMNTIKASGHLELEQNRPVDFRGSFNNTNTTLTTDAINLKEILTLQGNLSTLFYVDWDNIDPTLGAWPYFTLELKIKINDIPVYHSMPLVSSIEQILFMYISTLILFSLVLNYVQHICFRGGLLRTWIEPLTAQPAKVKGSID